MSQKNSSPLKDKEHYASNIETPLPQKFKVGGGDSFWKEDVKSAVAWLKQRMHGKKIITTLGGDFERQEQVGRINTKIKELIELVDEAFPDLK